MKSARVLVPLAVASLAGSAGAIEIISNLPGNDGTQSAVLSSLRIKSMGFTMPAGDNYDLDDVVLRLDITDPNVTPIVEVWSDSGGLPSAPLATLSNPVFSLIGIDNYSFTPSATVTLEAGLGYWIIAYAPPGTPTYSWKASSPAQTPVGLATHLGTTFVTNGALPPLGSSSTLASYAVNASVSGGGCEPDLTTGAIAGVPGYGVPNGILNNDDFFYYLAIFAANDPRADLTTGAIAGLPGYGVPNGIINNDDFFYYLALFAAGC
ncbi:MAG: choice-of-anchor R domain-containing protein [Phycisphaerales bacterium]